MKKRFISMLLVLYAAISNTAFATELEKNSDIKNSKLDEKSLIVKEGFCNIIYKLEVVL